MNKLLFLLMLLPITAAAQTHTFPAEDTNNTFTGTNIFTSSLATALAQYTVGTLPNATTTSPTREIVVVTDGQSASDCTSGGGSTASLCRTDGSSWVSLTGAGLFSGSCTTNQIVYGTASNTLGCSNSLKWTPSGTTGTAAFTNTTAATGVNNQSSPSTVYAGTYWDGAASQADTYSFQNAVQGGTNPQTALTITHSGSGSGGLTFSGVTNFGTVNSAATIVASTDIQSLQTSAATGGANHNSGNYKATGTYWTGAVSGLDTWNIQNVLGAGSNPTSTLTITHSGSSGVSGVSIPTVGVTEYCGATSGATQACAKTIQTTPIVVFGDVALNTATSQSITTLPFSDALYSCTGSDLTAAAGIVSFNTYASSSVTIVETGGANTDHLRYICVGR
jgi:hypothetical protein